MRTLALVSLVAAALSPAAALADPPKTPADVFGPAKVWKMHLTIQPKDWDTMQPTRQFGFGAPQPKGKANDRKGRGSFDLDFEYVKADLTIDGHVLKDVAVRFKGGGSYVSAGQGLKRPFKIDLDEHVADRTWGGLKKLTLNNNAMDPTSVREALSYRLYRDAGVPASRTAYAELTLTIPGKYDKELVGLYTLVESVDKTFLKTHFGRADGMLLKPERIGVLDHLGDAWPRYEAGYRPKAEPDKTMQAKLIALTKLLHQADEDEFHAKVGTYLDVDQFLRFLASTVVLASLDSFLGGVHNYYLYLDPKRDRFVFIPWDLDHSLGGFTIVGTGDALSDLSILQPYATQHRLIERVLSDDKLFAQYKKHLAGIVENHFTAASVKAELAAITKAIEPVRAAEKKAMAARREGGGGPFGGGMFQAGLAPEAFVEKRLASLREQLAGKTQGTPPRAFGFGPQPPAVNVGQVLGKRLLDALDADKDGAVSRGELATATRAFFKKCDKDNKGELDQAVLTAALRKLLPEPLRGAPVGEAPMANFGMPQATPRPSAATFSKAIFDRAARITADGLVAAAEAAFEKADKDKNGRLDAKELQAALREMFPAPPPGGNPFGPPGGPPGRPAGPGRK